MMFSMTEFISILGLLVTALGIFGTIMWRMFQQIRQNKTDLDAFKLQVAQEYVNSEHLTNLKTDLIRTEERTLSAIQGLTERFDRFLTRHNGE